MEESYIYIWDEISVQTQNIYFNRLEICPFVFIAKFNKYICIYVVYIYLCVCALCLLVMLTLVIPQSVACQAPLFIGFSKQEYWSGCHFLLQGKLPDPRIKHVSPVFQANFLLTDLQGKLYIYVCVCVCVCVCVVSKSRTKLSD